MNEKALKAALEEAERFTKAGWAAVRVLKENSWAGGKETAAAKRASMDLTRALANVRRAG